MKAVVALVVLVCVAAANAERNVAQRGNFAAGNQPYWFLGGPRSRSNVVQAYQLPISAADFAEDDEDDDDQEDGLAILNEDDEDDDSFDDDVNDNDDDDDVQEFTLNRNNIIGVVPLGGVNNEARDYWRSVLAKNGGNSGSIMVPDGYTELDGQGIVDEETGETALFLPREALAGIPDGSVVALVEDTESMGKANNYYVKRWRRGPKRGRRKGGRRRRRRGGNRRRRRPVVRRRPVRRGVKRRGNRRRRPNVIRL